MDSHFEMELRAVLEARNGAHVLNILNMSAFFALDENIRICTFSPVIPEPSELKDAIQFLERLGLVKCYNEAFFYVPSRIGAKLMDRLKYVSLERDILEKAILVLNKTKYIESPHLISVYRHAKLHPPLYSKMDLLPGIIIFGMIRIKKFQEAIDFGTGCLDLLKNHLGESHVTILDLQTQLATALVSVGKRQVAIKMLTDVYEKTCLVMGEKESLDALLNLAKIVLTDDLSFIHLENEPHLRKIVFKRKRITENLDELKVKKYILYAQVVLIPLGLTSVAISLLDDVIRVRKRAYGLADDYIYDAMAAKGHCLNMERRFLEGMIILRRVFLQRVALYGVLGEKTLGVMYYTGSALILRGDLDDALWSFEEIERDAKKVVGETHEFFLAAKRNIVNIYMLKQNLEKALEHNEELYEKLVAAFGLIHYRCFECKMTTAEILSQMNKPQEALKVFEDLEKFENTYAPLEFFEIVRMEILSTRKKCASYNAPGGTLHSFAKDGDLNKVLSLISTGHDVDGKDQSGMTPLHYASAFGRVQVAKGLIEKGAKYNSRAPSTPLQVAKGSEMTLLLKAVQSFFDAARTGNMNALIELYSKEPCFLGARDVQGCIPLHWAALNGHADVTRLLLDLGFDPTAVSGKSNSPLHIAASKGHENVARVLVGVLGRNGLNVRTIAGGNTPLHAAAEKGQEGVVRILLAHSAVCTTRNAAGKTPAQLSGEHSGCRNLLEIIEGLFLDARKGDVEAVLEKLRGLGEEDVVAVSGARDGDHRTLMQVAMEHKHFQLARKFLKLLKCD